MVNAQNKGGGFTGGIQAGISIANYNGVAGSPSNRSGGTLGVLWDIKVYKKLSLQPTFNFLTQLGYKETPTSTTATSIKVNNMEAKMNFVYHFTGKTGDLFIGAGPSASVAINGKWMYRNGTTYSGKDVTFGNNPTNDLRSLDLGVSGLVGYRFFKSLFISATYNRGLRNLTPKGASPSVNSYYYGISLGCLVSEHSKK